MPKKIEIESLPTRPTSHIKENDSVAVFMKLVSPWILYDIKSNADYGIDANVEITKDKLKSHDQLVTGKKFNVQLKSTTSLKGATEASVSVKKTTFLYWFACTTPVIVFLIDLKDNQIFYRKVDTKLFNEVSKKTPNFHAQETVTIKFSKEDLMHDRSLVQIQSWVYKWMYKPTKIITPGEYYSNVSEATEFVREFQSIVAKYGFNDYNKQIEENITEISNSIFNICIIGPSRQGKSTLINALTRREMSPVDVLPTTGVPIIMVPGNPEEVTVYFSDKPSITNKIDLDFIAEYADQKLNKKNKKNVTLLNVKLNSEFLEKGFSITDVPGIDDINQKIKAIAKSTIYSANVILYVISVGSHKQGEFKLTDAHLADLKEIKENMSRIFLVFNKIDLLNAKEIESLQEYIKTTLHDYGIDEMLAHEPIYISSKKSFEKRVQSKRAKDSVGELEDKMVKYLINGNLNGVNNLLSNFGASMQLIEQIGNICSVRLQNTAASADIQEKVSAVRTELKELQVFIQSQRTAAYKEIRTYISTNFANIISTLENDLKKRKYSNMPRQSEVTAYLKSQTEASVSRVYEYAQQVIYDLQSQVNIWVSSKLKQIQLSLDEINADPSFALLPMERFTSKIYSIYNIREKLSSNVLVTIINFAEKAITGLFDILGSIFRSEESLKKDRIQELMNPARQNFEKLETEFLSAVSAHLTKVCRFIENKTIERSQIYLDSMQAELDKVGKSLSQTERSNFQNLRSDLKILEEKGMRKMVVIKDYANGVL